MKVLDFPLVKLTISFIIGILISYYCHPSLSIAFNILGFSTLLFILFYFLAKRNKKHILLFGISSNLIAFSTGICVLLIHTDSFDKLNYSHFQKAFDEPHVLTFTLREKLKSNDYNDRYTAIVNNIDQHFMRGKIIVNVQKDSTSNR